MDQDPASMFTRLAPVLNVPNVAAERAGISLAKRVLGR